MLLSYQAKPAPDVEKFTTALSKENLGSDPVLAPYLADLRLNAHILKLKELIGAYVHPCRWYLPQLARNSRWWAI
jgi:hypothetical protein